MSGVLARAQAALIEQGAKVVADARQTKLDLLAADQVLRGRLTGIRFMAEDGTAILNVEVPNHGIQTVKGPWIGDPPQNGLDVIIHGAREIVSDRFGRQLRAIAIGVDRPATPDGIERWLKKSRIPGVGDASIKKLVQTFGHGISQVMENPGDLIHAGIGIGQAEAIAERWKNVRTDYVATATIELMGLPIDPPIPAPVAKKIVERYGTNLERQLATDPWAIAAEVKGVGFTTADKIAVARGVPIDSPGRRKAAILFMMRTLYEEDGHTAPPYRLLLERTQEMLAGGSDKLKEQPNEKRREDIRALYLDLKKLLEDEVLLVTTKIEDERDENGRLTGKEIKNHYIQLPRAARIERRLGNRLASALEGARHLQERLRASARLKRVAPQATSLKGAVEAALGAIAHRLVRPDGQPIRLTDEQGRGVLEAVLNPFSVLTGGPGRGKTATVQAIVAAYREIFGDEVSIIGCAPTANAADRMAEVLAPLIGDGPGKRPRTIHATLGFNMATGDVRYNERNPLSCQLLIVDETSMLDQALALQLLRAVDFKKTTVVFVGDAGQLPSVGPGRVLYDIIRSGVVPVTRLTKPQRMKEGSGPDRAAGEIENGTAPRAKGWPTRAKETDPFPDWETEAARHDAAGYKGYAFLEENDAGELQRRIVDFVTRVLKKRGRDPIKDVQVMAPGYKGEAGVTALNKALQAVLNPAKPDVAFVETSRGRFQIGDKVLHTEVNAADRGIINGRVGIVRKIMNCQMADTAPANQWLANANEVTRGEGKGMVIDFNGDLVCYSPADARTLELGYAISVHKMQGGERKTVVTVCHPSHWLLLARETIYTGLTRGKEESFIVGKWSAFQYAVRKQVERYTLLVDRIRTPEVEPAPVRAVRSADGDPERERGRPLETERQGGPAMAAPGYS